MRQIAYPAALGSCMAGAGVAPVRAAEWLITPAYSSTIDYDSNRTLSTQSKGSDAAGLSVDLKLQRAMEDWVVTFEPHYNWRRYSGSDLGNGDDRSVNAGIDWTGERSKLDLSASYLDQSTLVTEALETGLINGDTHRRAEQAGGNWTWAQTERRSLFVQASYVDVSYYGLLEDLLPGYRYPSGSFGEQFLLDDRTTVSVSAFGSALQGESAGNSSHEVGLQAEVVCAFSEKTHLDASVGESRRLLSGQSSSGTDAALSLDHSFFLGSLNLQYHRSLVPYGFGFLSEQQRYIATLVHPWSDYLDTTVSYFRTQANETAVLLRLDRRNYNTLTAGIRWRPAETWSLGADVSAERTQTPDFLAQPVNRWRTSVTLTWNPRPTSLSR